MPKTKIVDYRLRVCIDCAALSRASYQQPVDKKAAQIARRRLSAPRSASEKALAEYIKQGSCQRQKLTAFARYKLLGGTVTAFATENRDIVRLASVSLCNYLPKIHAEIKCFFIRVNQRVSSVVCNKFAAVGCNTLVFSLLQIFANHF
jgi:hypothetical protein